MLLLQKLPPMLPVQCHFAKPNLSEPRTNCIKSLTKRPKTKVYNGSVLELVTKQTLSGGGGGGSDSGGTVRLFSAEADKENSLNSST